MRHTKIKSDAPVMFGPLTRHTEVRQGLRALRYFNLQASFHVFCRGNTCCGRGDTCNWKIAAG
jgi:hypothetical protein